MDSANVWRELFENWPPSIPRKGLVVTRHGENIPFIKYLLSPGVVLLERDKPDTVGGRKILLAFDQIACVKIVDPLDLVMFQAMGFAPPAG